MDVQVWKTLVEIKENSIAKMLWGEFLILHFIIGAQSIFDILLYKRPKISENT